MNNITSRKGALLYCGIGLALSLFAYLLLYFGTTQRIWGQFQGDLLEVRLYRNRAHQLLFKPCQGVEELVKGASFSGQVHAGASLPPSLDETHIHVIFSGDCPGTIDLVRGPGGAGLSEGNGMFVYRVSSRKAVVRDLSPFEGEFSFTWDIGGRQDKSGIQVGGPFVISKEKVQFRMAKVQEPVGTR